MSSTKQITTEQLFFLVRIYRNWTTLNDITGGALNYDSDVLRQLRNKGFVESKPRIKNGRADPRGWKRYRITRAGDDWLCWYFVDYCGGVYQKRVAA